MRRTLLALALLFFVGSVWAHGGYRYHPHYHGHVANYNWAVPAIVGGVVGYAIARPPAPVVVPPQIVEVPPAPIGYHYESILDARCNCYRTVLVAN